MPIKAVLTCLSAYLGKLLTIFTGVYSMGRSNLQWREWKNTKGVLKNTGHDFGFMV